MKKIRYAVIGSGWRSLFYGRIARALPERFELAALCCRSAEKAARMRRDYGLPAVVGEEAVAAARPDFIVSAVSKQGMCETVRAWLGRGYPVLSETPAALSMEDLAGLWRLHQTGAKVQVAEQYRFYPTWAALLRLTESGLLGAPVSAYLSAVHDYHAAGLLRGLLGLGREEFCLTARTYTVPVTDTHTRTEVLTEGRVVAKQQRVAAFEYEGGCMAVYDFMSDQYHSLIRPRTVRLRGTRGEVDGREVRFLNEANLPENACLEVDEDPATGEVRGVAFRGRQLYRPPFGLCGLPEDETAIAVMLQGMADYIETGAELYPFADALEDAYTALLMDAPAARPGAGLAGGEDPFAGWRQRRSGPRPWKP